MTRQFPDPPARLHLIGIKGVAMTALAQILQGQGFLVTGSDVAEIFSTDAVLRRLGISYIEQFRADNIHPDTSAVVYSTAYGEDHPERRAAARAGLAQWSYPEVVQLFFELYPESVSVAGSHGKTTTTALLGHILEEAGYDPTVIVGSVDAGWGSNARFGQSDWFILETDEYQNKFQYYHPRYVLITNVDYDHPDFFKDRISYEEAFLSFAEKIPSTGALVLWGEEPMKLSIQSVVKAPLITYGFEEDNDWRLTEVRVRETGTSFEVIHRGKFIGQFTIPYPGEHYALNATGAMALAVTIGVSLKAIHKALTHFRGTSRRMEIRGEYRGAVVLDDYGHHPTEVRATLKALRARYPGRRLKVVFHPHTFSRTAAFLDAFALALQLADVVYVLPVYGSAREAQGGVTSEKLVDKINARDGTRAFLVDSTASAIETLKKDVQKGDIVVTMGAGDVWRVAEGLVT